MHVCIYLFIYLCKKNPKAILKYNSIFWMMPGLSQIEGCFGSKFPVPSWSASFVAPLLETAGPPWRWHVKAQLCAWSGAEEHGAGWICTYMHICIFISIWIYIYTYIHTYIHTYIFVCILIFILLNSHQMDGVIQQIRKTQVWTITHVVARLGFSIVTWPALVKRRIWPFWSCN